MNIPKQLQNPELRFVLLGKWDYWKNNKTKEVKRVNHEQYLEFKENKDWQPCGKMPFESAWATNGYSFDNQKLILHVANGNNIGIIGGYGRLVILDIDDPQLGEILQDKLNTFTTKTGSGGKHFYFYTNDEIENCVLANQMGEIRAKNYQVVVAGCTHPSGVEYEVFRDVPIREIKKEELDEFIRPYLRPQIKQNSVFLEQPKVEDTSRSGLEYRKVLSLLREGKTDDEINKIMMAYAKWASSPEQYKIHTLNSAKEFLSTNPLNKASKVFSNKGQAEIFNEIQPIFYDKNGLWWLWNSDEYRWKVVDDVDILNMISDATGEDIITPKNRTIILNSLKQEGRKRIPQQIKPTWIQFKDTIVDIETNERINADSKYFITNPIPYALPEDDLQDTPVMDRIFKEWVGESHIRTLYEIISYCMLSDYPINRLFCFIVQA